MKEKRDFRRQQLDIVSWTYDDGSWTAQVVDVRDGSSTVQGDAETREQAEALALEMLARMRLQSSGLGSLADSLDTIVNDWIDRQDETDPEGPAQPEPSAEAAQRVR